MAINLTPASIIADVNFGLGLLNSFGSRVDIVGIYNGSAGTGGPPSGISSNVINSILGLSNTQPGFGQLFANARPLKAIVRETSKVMEHPVETGQMVADYHIINPVEIDIHMVIQSEFYAATYAQIRQAFTSATLLSVKTRTGVYQNMIVADMPHEEDPEMYDAISLGLRLKQVLFFAPGTAAIQSNYQPASVLNNNTISNGLQQGVALAGKLLTTASSVISYASLAKRL